MPPDAYCCYPDCGMPPFFEIWWTPYKENHNTHSCGDHVEDMLEQGQLNMVYRWLGDQYELARRVDLR